MQEVVHCIQNRQSMDSWRNRGRSIEIGLSAKRSDWRRILRFENQEDSYTSTLDAGRRKSTIRLNSLMTEVSGKRSANLSGYREREWRWGGGAETGKRKGKGKGSSDWWTFGTGQQRHGVRTGNAVQEEVRAHGWIS